MVAGAHAGAVAGTRWLLSAVAVCVCPPTWKNGVTGQVTLLAQAAAAASHFMENAVFLASQPLRSCLCVCCTRPQVMSLLQEVGGAHWSDEQDRQHAAGALNILTLSLDSEE